MDRDDDNGAGPPTEAEDEQPPEETLDEDSADEPRYVPDRRAMRAERRRAGLDAYVDELRAGAEPFLEEGEEIQAIFNAQVGVRPDMRGIIRNPHPLQLSGHRGGDRSSGRVAQRDPAAPEGGYRRDPPAAA